MPLVTVYITNYNYQKYIDQSIKSVLNQTLQDFELLIIDDGSTDDSKTIIESYRDHPQISIIYQQNKGLNITNNVAMRAAKGKYIMRLDADDYLEPNALEVMSNVLNSDESLGLVFPNYYYVDKFGNITGEEKRHNFEKEVSLYDQPAHGACTMIRLKFLKELGGYNESFTCQDGYDLWIKFITHHNVVNVDRTLFSYRRHGENLTTNEEKILSTRRQIKEAFLREQGTELSSLVIIPVRNTKIKNVSWPLFPVGSHSTILDEKIKMVKAAQTISGIVITSSDPEIERHINSQYADDPEVILVERPPEFAGVTQTLDQTVGLCVDHTSDSFDYDAVMTVSLEYPFVQSETLDDMVHTLALFQSDSVLSVRPDNRMYYQHTGHTLHPILDQNKFVKIEREALYRGSGGLMLSSMESFRKFGKMNQGQISHIVIDERTAFGIRSGFDFEVFKKLSVINN